MVCLVIMRGEFTLSPGFSPSRSLGYGDTVTDTIALVSLLVVLVLMVKLSRVNGDDLVAQWGWVGIFHDHQTTVRRG